MDATTRTWLVGLLYPAALGAVFVNLISSMGKTAWSDPALWWAWVLVFYFLTQYSELQQSETTDGLVFDYAEWTLMMAGFFGLGVFPQAGSLGSGQPAWLAWVAIVGAFLAPPIKRFVVKGHPSKWMREEKIMGLLSLCAVAAAALGLLNIGTSVVPPAGVSNMMAGAVAIFLWIYVIDLLFERGRQTSAVKI